MAPKSQSDIHRKSPTRPMGPKDCTFTRFVGGRVRIERLYPSGNVHFGIEFTPMEWAKTVSKVSFDGEPKEALAFHMNSRRSPDAPPKR